MISHRVLVVLVGVALLAASCTTDDGDDAETSEPTTTTTTELAELEGTDQTTSPTTEAEVEAGPELIEDGRVCDGVPLEAVCGFVEVPVDHDDPDGDSLRVAVAVLRSTASAPTDDPVVYLEGGPGGNAIEAIAFRASDFYEPLLERSHVIVVDQRGVGRSEPALDCPEFYETLDPIFARADRTDAEEDAGVLEGIEACGDRLVDEGIDVNAFDSVANADDLDLVRRALDVDEWNLVGISYGTRLGLELLRRHPGPVRAAILDSVLPPEAEVVAGSVVGFQDSFERVEAACAADPDCSPEAPLGERLAAVVEALDASPVEVTVQNPLTLSSTDVAIDGDVLLGAVTGALYDPVLFSDLPDLLADLEAGSTEAIETYLTIDQANRDLLSIGMFQAVACSDDTNVTDPAVLDSLEADELWVRALDGLNIGATSFPACERFGATDSTPQSEEPVESDVPTLLIAGSFDPITPPRYAVDAAEDLSRSVVIEHPELGHAALSDPCVLEIALAFLDDPAVGPDAGCIDEAPPVDFTPDGLGDLALGTVTADVEILGVEITADLPTAWAPQAGSQTDRARLRGILDPTAVSLVAAEEQLAAFVIDFLADSLEVQLVDQPPVEAGGDTWVHRSGTTGSTVIDAFERGPDDNGLVSVYVLTSSMADREALIEQVVLPGLASMEAAPLG